MFNKNHHYKNIMYFSSKDFLSLGILMPVAPVHLGSLGASRLLIGGLTSLNALLQLTTGPLVVRYFM